LPLIVIGAVASSVFIAGWLIGLNIDAADGGFGAEGSVNISTLFDAAVPNFIALSRSNTVIFFSGTTTRI
jgi:hypothetical protein